MCVWGGRQTSRRESCEKGRRMARAVRPASAASAGGTAARGCSRTTNQEKGRGGAPTYRPQHTAPPFAISSVQLTPSRCLSLSATQGVDTRAFATHHISSASLSWHRRQRTTPTTTTKRDAGLGTLALHHKHTTIYPKPLQQQCAERRLSLSRKGADREHSKARGGGGQKLGGGGRKHPNRPQIIIVGRLGGTKAEAHAPPSDLGGAP